MQHHYQADEQSVSSLKRILNRALFNLKTPIGKRTNIIGMVVIILSVMLSMFGTLQEIDSLTREIVRKIELGVTILFAVEYLLRVWVARNRKSYILSFLGLVDLLTWIPIVFGADPYLALRLLRILRLLKLLRYLSALRLFLASLRDVLDIILVVLATIALIALIGGNAIYLLEPENFGNAFAGTWWGFVTMTTVGYGDMVPKTAEGKMVATALMLIGISIFALLTGTISVKISHLLINNRECSKCDHTISDDYDYCPFCGSAQTEVEKLYCSQCGNEHHDDDHYCAVCGTAFMRQENDNK
jgi:voltage-gated potassium channel